MRRGLEGASVVRVEVRPHEGRATLVVEHERPIDPATTEWLTGRLAGLLGPELRADVMLVPRVREVLLAHAESGAEQRELVLAQQRADEDARLAELTGHLGGGEAAQQPWTVVRGRAWAGPLRPIADVVDDEPRVAIEGEVVAAEVRTLKTGRRLLCFDVTDYGDTLPVKCYLERDEPAPASVKPGAWVRVRGTAQMDRFQNNELVLLADDILVGTPPRRVDQAPEKRVELHLHTKMSAMDGCLDVEAAIRRAAEWGHPAIAVTDSGVVQSYPAAYQAARQAGIQLIFGMEAFVVDDGAPVVQHPQPWPLDRCTWIGLDVETTGLSPAYDEILEIGAVKLRGGSVIDEFNALLRPSRPVPDKVQQLTGITSEMVGSAASAAEVLSRFWDWVEAEERPLLVAHNAAFDLAFCRIWTERLLGRGLPGPFADTLWLARALLPRLKSHALANVARELGVRMDQHHRALSDARTAAAVFGALVALARRRAGAGELTVADLNRLSAEIPPEQVRPNRCTVLVRDKVGLRRLYRLVSASHLEHFHRVPRLPRRLLEEEREGLLIGSGDGEGDLFEAVLRGAPDVEVRERALRYDFIELLPVTAHRGLIARGAAPSEEAIREVNRRLYALGRELGKPVAATGDVHYLDPKDKVFRAILKASQGQEDESDNDLHFRTTDEMLAEFAYLGEEAAREVVIDNPRRIAALCQALTPVPEGLFTPEMPGADQEVRDMAYRTAREWYGDPLPDLVARRLERELGAIVGNGYAVIYLIAHKLVKRSLDDGYLVGSRGSVGSSLVATLCRITEVNPLPPHYRCERCRYSEFVVDGSIGSGFDLPDKPCPRCGLPLRKDGHDIPFETFLGFEGDKVPDIDLNFSGEHQAAIHRYTEELFGADHVFRAGTIATVADRTAFGFVKSFLERQGRTARRSELNRLSLGCTGVKRTTGQHPGGMIIVPAGHDITEFTPVQYPADDRAAGMRTTHFDFHSLHDNLLKLDILGHDDPTVLRLLADLTGVDPQTIPFDDPATQSLFRGTDALGLSAEELGSEVGTIGVPEFGTAFVRRMLVETKPRTFSDLVRISGLSHGTDVWTNNAQSLIRDGTATLSEVIPCRDDIMVYLMYRGLEPKLAFRIMESVRKGKGLTPEFEAAMRGHGIPEWYIESCRKIRYLFPKAHAVAYVMMGFRIAWFKVHHPLAFYASYFTVRADEFDADLICQGLPAIRKAMEQIERKVGAGTATAKEKNLQTILEVAKEMLLRGLRFQRVDLYRSDPTRFKIVDGALLPPLRSLQGLGETAAQNITAARAQGPFQSLEDLRARARLSKTVIELLHSHGAVAGLPESNQLVLF